jgi:hypothetical protein
MAKKSQNLKMDYEVGFGKPPKSTRFVKGQSGNPNGRPKVGINFKTMVKRVLSETVIVNEGGQRKYKSKLEVAMTQIANKAASGDIKATQMMIGLAPVFDEIEQQAALSPDLIADREHAQKIAARLTKNLVNKVKDEEHED